MKKITLIAFLILSISYSFGQENFIQLTKNKTGKVKLFKENKRVKVKTLDGRKIIGRFSIVNESTISIKGQEIKLENIEHIKSRSVVAGVARGVLIVVGSISLVSSAAADSVVPSTVEKETGIIKGATIVGLVIVSAGIFMNEFVPTHRSSKWSYKIIEK